MVTTFRPQTMQEAVLQELRRRIHDGELRPGTVIRVDAVAGALGVSRIPVREALMILEGEGLVTHRPHVGFTVPSLTAEELEEIYFVRALLEDEALRRALENTTDADRAAAREACRAAEEALHHGQVNAFSDNGRRFHEAPRPLPHAPTAPPARRPGRGDRELPSGQQPGQERAGDPAGRAPDHAGRRRRR